MGLTSLEKFEVRCTKAILAFSEVFLHIPCFGVHKNISKRRGLCYGDGKRTKLDVYRKKGCEAPNSMCIAKKGVRAICLCSSIYTGEDFFREYARTGGFIAITGWTQAMWRRTSTTIMRSTPNIPNI